MRDHASAIAHILNRLEKELPDSLTYHDYRHTLDVMTSAKDICKAEGIEPHECQLMQVASAYHDSGFLNTYANHEEEGCLLAREYLPQFGFSATDIDIICELIMATKIPHAPKNRLEEIICDADLDYLGRDDVREISETLFREFKHWGIISTDEEWKQMQISFLTMHRYFTEYSKKNRIPGKLVWLEKVKSDK